MSTNSVEIAFFGGKCLKLFLMTINGKNVKLELLCDMGKFSGWILDVAWSGSIETQVSSFMFFLICKLGYEFWEIYL